MVMERLSEIAQVAVVETADVKNSSKTSAYQKMDDFDRIFAIVICGTTWNAGDGLTTCKLLQAKTSAGGNAKDLTTSGSGKNYDTDNKVGGAGSFVILEARAEDLDHANGFDYVAVQYASTDNGGTDNATAVIIGHRSQHAQKQLQGAAAAGTKAYVTPYS